MDKFDIITDFVKCKEFCVFCNTPLKAVITNYVGVSGHGIPVINAPLKNDRFEFNIKHTTPNFDAKADVTILIDQNTLFFDNFTNGEFPSIDEHLIRSVFESYGPHFELFCPSRKCGMGYYISSLPIRLTKIHTVAGMWNIAPFGMFNESVKIGSYIVSNNWAKKQSLIYSRKNIEASPITVPMVDFTTTTKEKLITRIKILVTFS